MKCVLSKNNLVLGRLLCPYGIYGWVKIRSYTEKIEGLMSYHPLWIDKDGLKPLFLDDWQMHSGGLIAHIEGVNDRDRAKAWCGCNILVDKDVLPSPDVNEYYWHELLGLRIRNLFAGEEDDLGVVSSLLATGSNDVLLVSGDKASIDYRERLIPFIEDYVLKVSRTHGYIQVSWDPDF